MGNNAHASWLDGSIASPRAPHYTQFANGMRVVVLQQPQRIQSMLRFFVACGSRFEPANQAGISHLLEHMLFQGNSQYATSTLLEEGFEQAGVFTPEAMTGIEESEYRLSCHAKALPHAIQNLAVLLRKPLFLPQQVCRERAIVIEELLDAYNTKGYVIDAEQLLMRCIWQGHPLGQPVGGYPGIVQNITPSQLQQWHTHYYQPQRCVVGVAGPHPPEEVVTHLQAHFGNWENQSVRHPVKTTQPIENWENQSVRRPVNTTPPIGNWENQSLRRPVNTTQPTLLAQSAKPAPPSVRSAPCLCWQEEPHSQLSLLLRFLGPGYSQEKALKPIEMLVDILDGGIGARLQRMLREEKHHLYYVGADYTALWDVGYLDVQLSFHPKHLTTTVEDVLGVLEDLYQRAPSKKEVETARKRCLMQLWQGVDSVFAQIERYAWPLLYGQVCSEDTESAQFREIEQAQVAGAARGLLHGKNVYAALTGPVVPSALEWLGGRLTTWAEHPCVVMQGEKGVSG